MKTVRRILVLSRLLHNDGSVGNIASEFGTRVGTYQSVQSVDSVSPIDDIDVDLASMGSGRRRDRPPGAVLLVALATVE